MCAACTKRTTRRLVRTARWVTDVRTHRLHLRGGGGLGQVDSGNTLMAVVHVPDTLPDLSETDRVSREGFAQGKLSALELDPAVLLDPSHLELRVVIPSRGTGRGGGGGDGARADAA